MPVLRWLGRTTAGVMVPTSIRLPQSLVENVRVQATRRTRRRRHGGSLTIMPADNLEPRVSALETQVHRLTERVRASEQDAAAARVLAGAADRDVTEFRGELRDFRRATTASFNAVRADLTDLRSHVDNGFTEIRGKLDATAAGQQHIVELLQGRTTDQG